MIDPSKPMRTVATDWQPSVPVKLSEARLNGPQEGEIIVEIQEGVKMYPDRPAFDKVQRRYFRLKDGGWSYGDQFSLKIENVPEEKPVITEVISKPVDLEKPIRLTAYGEYEEVYDLSVVSFSDNNANITVNAPHLVGTNHVKPGVTWAFNLKDGSIFAYEGRSPVLENYDEVTVDADIFPPEPTIGIDWSKPIRTKATDWQHSVAVVSVEFDSSDDTYLATFAEPVYVSLHAKNIDSGPDEELYFWADNGQSYEQPKDAEPDPEMLYLENWNPDIMALDTPAPTAEENEVATKEAEAKERWDYPKQKKHDLDESELLFHLRRLVHRNNVESWHLSRIKTEGFGAKRFVINRRKPVVWRDFRTGKTFVMKNVTLHDEDEGTFSALNEKDSGYFTESTENTGRVRVWTKDGLYRGQEEEKQFGLFNEEILTIYELTIESESSLTELLSAVYGELD